MNDVIHVVDFSGGKDSTAMLFKMLEHGIKVDRIIHVDTTKEFPQMYEHINRVKDLIYPLKIETVELNFDYWFSEHVKTKGKRAGSKGYGFPDYRNRWCTALKRDLSNRLKNKISGKYVEFHGIALDEQHRTLRNKGRNIRYPLIELGMTEKQALDYCYSMGFSWGGLYDKFSRVSCWCCPLARISNLKSLYNNFPELWKELELMESNSFRQFRYDYSVSELGRKFHLENKETS